MSDIAESQKRSRASRRIDDPTEHVPPLHFRRVRLILASRYIAEGILSANMLADAQHIAMATIARVDALVSWNFRHVVNLPRIHAYHRVNARRGYATLEIRSPREVLADE